MLKYMRLLVQTLFSWHNLEWQLFFWFPCHASQSLEIQTSELSSWFVGKVAKSEICNGAAVVCDAAGVTPLGGSEEILKNGSS